jgi:hypothetical protein
MTNRRKLAQMRVTAAFGARRHGFLVNSKRELEEKEYDEWRSLRHRMSDIRNAKSRACRETGGGRTFRKERERVVSGATGRTERGKS